jgi:cysteinyl-tRNA synthetase
MHVNFLNADKGKMSKSSGDFLRLETLKEKNINPLAYRYLLLMTHYRKEIKFSFESLEAAENAYNKLLKQVEKNKGNTVDNLSELGQKYFDKFVSAMNDDLNTSIALATLWSILGDKELSNQEKYTLMLKTNKYLGLGI